MDIVIATTTSFDVANNIIGYTVTSTQYPVITFLYLCLKFGMGIFVIVKLVKFRNSKKY